MLSWKNVLLQTYFRVVKNRHQMMVFLVDYPHLDGNAKQLNNQYIEWHYMQITP